MSEIKTVRNRSGGGALRSSISPSKEFASPLRSRFHVTKALLGKEDLFTKKELRRGTSRGTVGSGIYVSLQPDRGGSGEPVAESAHGLYIGLITRLREDLAQPLNVDVDRALVDFAVVTPHLRQ